MNMCLTETTASHVQTACSGRSDLIRPDYVPSTVKSVCASAETDPTG